MAIKWVQNGGVTSPAGFLASGMHAGIKANKRKLDTSLIVSQAPAVSAGVFTVNQAKAWPLLYDMKVIKRTTHRAILANSGNANCFNGESGSETVRISSNLLAKKLGIKRDEVFLASTGVIGRAFPIKKLKAAIPVLVGSLSREGAHAAAQGILTTDTIAKEAAVQIVVGGEKVTFGVMAKGSGMVYPEMNVSGKPHATMLCFITTDLRIKKSLLTEALNEVVNETFNCISVDNDMSTNDIVLVLANGLAQNAEVRDKGKEYELIKTALRDMCWYIARELVKDGEGVRHVCEIRINGAKDANEARKASQRIATSMLVKTMLTGEDPNWGRVVAAIGASGISFSHQLDVAFDGVVILKNGKPIHKNLTPVRQVLKKKEFVLNINLKKGNGRDKFLTTDLTKFYVWINASYTS